MTPDEKARAAATWRAIQRGEGPGRNTLGGLLALIRAYGFTDEDFTWAADDRNHTFFLCLVTTKHEAERIHEAMKGEMPAGGKLVVAWASAREYLGEIEALWRLGGDEALRSLGEPENDDARHDS